MNRIDLDQQQRNRLNRDGWQSFAGHRRKVTELLVSAQPGKSGRLCVLGAGNCNDLDLGKLTEAFSEVHLVDIDGAAMAQGLASQAPAKLAHIQLHAGIDVSGCNELMAEWTPAQPPTAAEVQRCVEAAGALRMPKVPGPFDVVASVCLLTQLFDAVANSLGGDHPHFMDLLTAVRARHLQLLLDLLSPGGTALLITDFVSSTTFPPLAMTPEMELPAVAAKLIESKNFFTGANPFVLQALMQNAPYSADELDPPQVSLPWLWDHGARVYAVCAIAVRKQG